jgi:hypothetical protein
MPAGITPRNGREDVEEAAGRQGDKARERRADNLSIAETRTKTGRKP